MVPGFRFLVDDAHRSVRVARLRLPAGQRAALLRCGIETLDELHGMHADRVTALDAAARAELVRELRWRCAISLPSWSLLHPTPVAELWLPAVVRYRLLRHGLTDVASLFACGDVALESIALEPALWGRHMLDVLARVAELPAATLTEVAARAEPWRLPAVDPLIVLALAHATDVDEQVVALSLGGPERDSLLLLARWIHTGPAGPAYEELARRFGITAERARQIVTTREEQLRTSGLRVPARGPGTWGNAESLRLLLRRLGVAATGERP